MNENKNTSKKLNKIPLSVLDLVPVLSGKTPAESFKNSLELARHVESWGFQRYWLAEHHNMAGIASTATSVLIGHIAGGTSKIRVGSGGVMLPNHAPLIIAEQFGTLASLYPGRIDLGLGRAPGTDQLTTRALRRHLSGSVEDFPANVEELKQYLSPANNTAPVRSIPGEGLDIPIWLLGSSTYSAQLAGILGLPFAFASHFAPTNLHIALNVYRNNFKPSERLKEPYAMAGINVVAADTDEQAQKLATSLYMFFLSVIRGGKSNQLAPPVEDMENYWTEPEKNAAMQMLHYTLIGGPASVKNELQSFVNETQVDEVMVVSNIYDQKARLTAIPIIANVYIFRLRRR
jgi:luciferase family oxidoreductase group 1